MSAVALVGVPRVRPVEDPPQRQPQAPPIGVDDLGALMRRLDGLGVTVRVGDTTRGASADWDADHRCVTLRPDTTLYAATWFLRDLYLLHTDPAHVSPSVPSPHLTVLR